MVIMCKLRRVMVEFVKVEIYKPALIFKLNCSIMSNNCDQKNLEYMFLVIFLIKLRFSNINARAKRYFAS